MEDDFFDQDDLDGNIFDDDDALDYIIYEECERDVKKNNGAGCLGMIVGMVFVSAVAGFVLAGTFITL